VNTDVDEVYLEVATKSLFNSSSGEIDFLRFFVLFSIIN